MDGPLTDDEALSHARDVQGFLGRVFSGHDLVHVLEIEGIGVGHTMALVERVERAPHGRPLTFDADVTVPQVKQALKDA